MTDRYVVFFSQLNSFTCINTTFWTQEPSELSIWHQKPREIGQNWGLFKGLTMLQTNYDRFERLYPSVPEPSDSSILVSGWMRQFTCTHIFIYLIQICSLTLALFITRIIFHYIPRWINYGVNNNASKLRMTSWYFHVLHFWTVEQSEIKDCMNLNHWFNALSSEHTKWHVSNTPQCYGINRITKCSELKSSQWIFSCDFNFFLLCLRTSSFSEVDEDFVLLLFLSNLWHQSLFQLVIPGEGG